MDWLAAYDPRTKAITHAKKGTKEYWHEVGHKRQDDKGILTIEDTLYTISPLVAVIASMVGSQAFWPVMAFALALYAVTFYLEVDAQLFAEKQMLKKRG